MSERINVDQAFDPEARKAQADFDAYMDTRPYRDGEDNIHAAKGGELIDADEYHDAVRDAHYDNSLEQGDYSKESLEQLAQRVATARAEGDKTRAADAEDTFFNRFAEYSEKYGWENEDGSADGPHVDKSAKLGRSTIDDRLDRYSKIMYGNEPVNAQEAPVAKSDPYAQDEFSAIEPQNDSHVPAHRGEYKDETDIQIDDDLTVKHRADNTNKELASSTLKILDEAPTRSASNLKILNENGTKDDDSRSSTRRIRDALTPAGAVAEVSAWAATREKGSRRNRLTAALGGAALAAGIGWLLMRGHDASGIRDIVTPDVAPTPDATPTPDIPSTPGGNGGHQLIETVRVHSGDGEIKVTQSLLDSNGIHVNVTEAQRIGEHAQVHDILKNDSSYTHSGSTMDRIGKTGKFEARKGIVPKLLKAARQLGYK